MHPANIGVTVIVAVAGEDDEFTAINGGIDPDPEAVSPILGLSFVQLNVDPAVPVKGMAIDGDPEQTD